jgi:hypothetical protein
MARPDAGRAAGHQRVKAGNNRSFVKPRIVTVKMVKLLDVQTVGTLD